MMNINRIFNAICLFIAASTICYMVYSKNQSVVTTNDALKKQVVTEAKIISQKIDKNSLQHTIVEETNNILPYNLIDVEDAYSKAFVDSLIAQTDIQKKEIVSLMKVNQTITGKNLQAVAVIDSMNRKKYTFKDNNLFVTYTPDLDSLKAGRFDYSYNQDVNFIQYSRKKWLFGAEHNYIDISSTDPYSTINGVRKLSVQQPDKDFGIKVTARTVYLPQSGNIGVGGQLRVRYKRITATGSILYFPQVQKWIPVARLEYDLLNY
jgi:hypothetical protein